MKNLLAAVFLFSIIVYSSSCNNEAKEKRQKEVADSLLKSDEQKAQEYQDSLLKAMEEADENMDEE